jgi:hypothetical protein
MDAYKVDFEALSWQTPEPGMRSKTYKKGKKQIRLVEFTDQYFDPNWCTRGHVGFMLEGEMDINFNGRPMTFRKGDGLLIPAGEKNKHMVKVHTGQALVVLIEEL